MPKTPRRVASDSVRAHALDLMAAHPFIDGHNDLPWVVRDAGSDFKKFDIAHPQVSTDTDIPRLREGRVSTQVFAAYLPTLISNPATVTLEQIDIVLRMEEKYAGTFHPVRTPDDVVLARQLNKIGSLLSVEGTVGLEGSLAPLRLWHKLGVRLVTLCHNETLPWIDSATDKPGRDDGLSKFGRDMIGEMNRLGLVIDLAHVAPRAMHKVLDATASPLMITHTNATALCAHPRNTPDDVLARIPKNGGLVMATFVPGFLNPSYNADLAPFKDTWGKNKAGIDGKAYKAAQMKNLATWNKSGVAYVADHIEYFRDKVGEEHIGIGSDFYGGSNPPGLEDASKFPDLIAELVRRGWKDASLIKLMGENFLRVWRDVLAASCANT